MAKPDSNSDRWTIGCDPGFGETGLVLMHGRELVAWATFSCPPNGNAYLRTVALAQAVHSCCASWVGKYIINNSIVDFVIETPIYKKNAHSFELQWRLVQSIEEWAEELCGYVTEVPPTTSKRLATGSGKATKVDMVEASPFSYLACTYVAAEKPANPSTIEALADAWAHSLASWGGCPDCTRFAVDVNLPGVKNVCAGQR